MKSQVSLVRCQSYEPNEVKSALMVSSLGLGVAERIEKGQTILVKPNLFQGFSPEKCGTSHPSVVKAVIEILQDLGAIVLVGDNPACLKSQSLDQYAEIAKITGIEDVVHKTGSRLVYPDEVTETSGWTISKIALEVDGIVNVPKLKGHGFMGITGSVKNIFGLIPGLRKLDYHAKIKKRNRFAQMLVELCLFARPLLTVMDAVEILDREGSVARKPQPIGALLTSFDPFAVDLVAAMLLRLDPRDIPVIEIALKKRLLGFSRMEIVGEKPEEFQLPKLDFPKYVLPNTKLKGSKDTGLPQIDEQQCMNCGTCIMVCPASAIRALNEVITIHKDLCSRCYCCLEACRFGALYLA